MKKYFCMLFAALAALSCGQKPAYEASMPYKIVDGKIRFETPAREPGQQTALQMTCDPIDTVRVGIVGIGNRGIGAVRRYTCIPGAKLVALCDLREERVKKAQDLLAEAGCEPAKEYVGEDAYKALCESDDIDLVYVCTNWTMHTPVALYALEHGKHAVTEVPSAPTLKECWAIVDACEKTRKHFMMLENCCYDRFEMTALNMAQQGLFGEVYHAEGAYIHVISDHWNSYYDNWRMKFDQAHAGDNYPTHGLGPICQVLNIHRGDKMNTLVSMDTKSINGLATSKDVMNVDEFAEGDHVVTLIRTENGHQIEVQHNVYGPRPYSRMYQLTGDKGFANKYPVEGFCIEREALPEAIRDKEVYSTVTTHELSTPEMMAAFDQDFKHPVIAQNEEMAAVVGGHGGMDYIMDARLIYCLNNGLPLDMDVYDAAEWSCVRELSEVSIKNGSMPVEVPDFTRGDWNVLDGVHHAFK